MLKAGLDEWLGCENIYSGEGYTYTNSYWVVIFFWVFVCFPMVNELNCLYQWLI